MDTAGMTLMSDISPLSSWLRRWQCITYRPVYSSNRVRIARMPGWITVSSLCMLGAGALALSMANWSGPVRRPVVGSKYSVTWKSLTWTWIGCSSLLLLTNLHSSTELSRGWISGTLGNAPPSNAYTNAFGSSVLAMLLRNPPDITICRLTSGLVLARSIKDA